MDRATQGKTGAIFDQVKAWRFCVKKFSKWRYNTLNTVEHQGATIDQSQRRNLWLVNSGDNAHLSGVDQNSKCPTVEVPLHWSATFDLVKGATPIHFTSASLWKYRISLSQDHRSNSWGAKFDSPEVQPLTTYIYIHIYLSSASLWCMYIYVYATGATSITVWS